LAREQNGGSWTQAKTILRAAQEAAVIYRPQPIERILSRGPPKTRGKRKVKILTGLVGIQGYFLYRTFDAHKRNRKKFA
jgi:hypothetical protein